MVSDYKEHRKRWNIEVSDKEMFEKLKEAIISILARNLGGTWSDMLDIRFCKEALITYKSIRWNNLDFGYTQDFLSKIKTKVDFFYYLQILLALIKKEAERVENDSPEENKDKEYEEEEDDEYEEDEDFDDTSDLYLELKWVYKKVIKKIKEVLSQFSSGVIMLEANSEIIFLPEGAKILDEKLVNDVLGWLSEYKLAYVSFKSALDIYEKKGNRRNLADNLRASLEFFLKEYLSNEKPLEKQGDSILKYLESENISPRIRNMFWTLLDHYAKYQDENSKHNDLVKENEVEFLIYQTGTFIRFLIKLKVKL